MPDTFQISPNIVATYASPLGLNAMPDKTIGDLYGLTMGTGSVSITYGVL